jgi:hypothetical protein
MPYTGFFKALDARMSLLEHGAAHEQGQQDCKACKHPKKATEYQSLKAVMEAYYTHASSFFWVHLELRRACPMCSSIMQGFLTHLDGRPYTLDLRNFGRCALFNHYTLWQRVTFLFRRNTPDRLSPFINVYMKKI